MPVKTDSSECRKRTKMSKAAWKPKIPNQQESVVLCVLPSCLREISQDLTLNPMWLCMPCSFAAQCTSPPGCTHGAVRHRLTFRSTVKPSQPKFGETPACFPGSQQSSMHWSPRKEHTMHRPPMHMERTSHGGLPSTFDEI